MKKIFTAIFGVCIATVSFAQNNYGNMHIFNDETYRKLYMEFTAFTENPSSCSNGMQAMDVVKLPPGAKTMYTTFAASMSTANPPHPYPIDMWSGGPGDQIPPAISNTHGWGYIKFQLKEAPNVPGTMTPTLGGSVGFYPGCSGVPASISGTATQNGINYSFKAEAFTAGGDLWVHVW
ncbi:hypothetical protein [Chryseobacterium arthrosphaerae]|uniref:hypothetical protein n=1 Tax=Chryseobacterium arthrosphaerae TaxID=651561 RepID=UPI001E288212|nr:hypothetical protein [Chryseobacterium arthrosphaerae]UEQ77938.1 hypothetical protein J8N07_06455 [Chryseobacterium arthrosphaerae]